MTHETYTEDLAKFGSRERHMLAEILALPLPSNWNDSGTKPAMNMDSGYVFLVNEDYQCCMINSASGKLEIYHNTPYDGYEGFISDLLSEYEPDKLHRDDAEYIRENAKAENVALPEKWQE